MQIITTIQEMRATLAPHRRAGRSVGLVPTMGFLHRGHMALADRSRVEVEVTVLSIFVNPTQFAPNEDFSTYPRDLDRDLDLCRAHGIDIVFAPAVSEMYPEPMDTVVEVQSLSPILIGSQRPGHFRGVATVVTKLFNIVEPDRAYFGEKDFQQLAVIRRMVRDLSMKVEIVGVPTVREADGLAASSRNTRLEPAEREAASVVFRALDAAGKDFAAGQRDADALVRTVEEVLATEPRVAPQSVDIRHAGTLGALRTIGSEPSVVLVTVKIGDVLLIDQRELGDGDTKGSGR